LAVARAFTQASAEHDRLWSLVRKPGVLTLRGQIDLWQMLQPAIQPGAKLDHDRPTETVSVVFAGAVWPETKFADTASRTPPGAAGNEVKFTRKARENDWLPSMSSCQPVSVNQE
jgi:hypothetical protein